MSSTEVFEFGPFRLEAETRSLFREGEFVSLQPKAAEMLCALVESAGRVVTKEQLLERVGAGVVVEEGAIANNISALRKVLDSGFEGDGPIATVARRGYRFTATVSALAAGPTEASPASVTARVIERDTILVGDIENKTGDPIFDGTIRQALALGLAQSSHLDVLSDRRVHASE